jgi:phosphohistidine phosphatase
MPNLCRLLMLSNHFSQMLCFVVLQNAPVKTCSFFLKTAISSKTEVHYSDQLYDFSGSALEAFIHSMDSNLSNVFIFGHNHALTAIVNEKGDQYIENIPTCGIVKINFKTNNWSDCSKGVVEFKLFPKNLNP